MRRERDIERQKKGERNVNEGESQERSGRSRREKKYSLIKYSTCLFFHLSCRQKAYINRGTRNYH